MDPEEPFALPIDGVLDLHAFAPADVVSVVQEYLEACAERRILRVRIVHGRGKGVQRAEVRRLLAAHPRVASCADAAPEEGGWGATIVHLRGAP
ncbi:MAG TPA: Smr/MutS family protein [Vicinamibacteria bacterium]